MSNHAVARALALAAALSVSLILGCPPPADQYGRSTPPAHVSTPDDDEEVPPRSHPEAGPQPCRIIEHVTWTDEESGEEQTAVNPVEIAIGAWATGAAPRPLTRDEAFASGGQVSSSGEMYVELQPGQNPFRYDFDDQGRVVRVDIDSRDDPRDIYYQYVYECGQ